MIQAAQPDANHPPAHWTAARPPLALPAAPAAPAAAAHSTADRVHPGSLKGSPAARSAHLAACMQGGTQAGSLQVALLRALRRCQLPHRSHVAAMSTRPFAQVIETSEEEAYVECAKYIAQLGDGDQVRLGGCWRRAAPDRGPRRPDAPPRCSCCRRAPSRPLQRSASSCTPRSSMRSCWTSSSRRWTQC